MKYIQFGKDADAEIATHGNLPFDPVCKDEFLALPPGTVFKHVTREMAIIQEEMFGPVDTVTPFETEDEAVSITNASKYGLVGYVYTRDHEKGFAHEPQD